MTKESSASPRERGVCVEGGVIESRRQYSSSGHCYRAWIHPAASRCLGTFFAFCLFHPGAVWAEQVLDTVAFGSGRSSPRALLLPNLLPSFRWALLNSSSFPQISETVLVWGLAQQELKALSLLLAPCFLWSW